MLTPQNDEERKALRLRNASYSCTGHNASCGTAHLMEEENRNFWMAALAEARRIVLEELGGESHESLSRQLNAALIESDDLRRQLDDAKVSDEIHRNHVEALTSSLRALNDLDEVRADITRTAAVVQALSAALTTQDTGDGILVSLLESARTQEHRLAKLLSRERELMDKSEPEGGDRG